MLTTKRPCLLNVTKPTMYALGYFGLPRESSATILDYRDILEETHWQVLLQIEQSRTFKFISLYDPLTKANYTCNDQEGDTLDHGNSANVSWE
jgi:hypothetical protein